MAERYLGQPRRRGGWIIAAILLLILLFSSRYIASTFIEYSWWTELGQADTWLNLLLYGTVPVILATILFFAIFWIAFKLGIRRETQTARFGFLRSSLVMRIALLVLFVAAIIAANATVDNWTVVRYFGGQRLPQSPGEFVDPIFHHPLHFYFFGLPFYTMLLRVVLVATILSLIIFWLASHVEALTRQLPTFGPATSFEFDGFKIREAFDSGFVRLVLAIFLLGLAAKFYYNRYDLLLEDHSAFLVGINWVAEHIVLPMQWIMIFAAVLGGILVLARQGRIALLLLLILPVRFLLPGIISALYVRPNELALERPYIHDHIEATRSAYGLNGRVKETSLEARPEVALDYQRHKPLLDNVRLWDWRAFHDTVSQIQPLRPYIYLNTDVDRYTIDGQLRQVLISPRELDPRQLGEARNRWINPHLMYTHGYGLVMAEANRITADGLPVLFIKDAPPVVTTSSLKVTQPEIYYGEVEQDPVFVHTGQQEFNYPSGSQSVYTTYQGAGGFPVGSALLRLAATVNYGDINIILTSYLTANSRMMIHRPLQQRLSTLAGFITWDSDPYMVLTDAGHLVWMIDGYMTSSSHPYARELDLGEGNSINYIRNSVKATIDAYSGETNMYVFDSSDVLIQAYWRLFPKLFKPASSMPADLRRHARYPETLFSAQAEIYRTFHMRDPEAFYNRADLWDLARTTSHQGDTASAVSPTYIVATMPGDNKPEFLLITPFTPANKDNLIAMMSARCDGDNLGELVFEQLSKQNIIFGPMQIEARINQDQNISKDLTLWNQQGSQVLRGQTLVLPIENTFLYVEPIYIQASQASMPQLKKVALAMGNKLAYADTYEQAISQLIDQVGGTPAADATQNNLPQGNAPAQGTNPSANQATATPSNISADAQRTLIQIRDHLARYRELSSQGKWAEAGHELDEIQKLVAK